MSTEYQVIIEKFAERHFIKRFNKKYKKAWELTLETLVRQFQSFDVLFERNIAETITDLSAIKICKTEFKIAGTDVSRHGSGNRCIVAIHKEIKTVCVLLVYHKNDLGHGNETEKWKNMVKENYPKYKELL